MTVPNATQTQTNDFVFVFLNFGAVPKSDFHLTLKASWNNRDEDRKMRIHLNSDVFDAVTLESCNNDTFGNCR